MKPRLFSTSTLLRNGHENPLGLPRTGTIPRMARGLPQRRPIKDVKKVVAVSSAKGGVGKSTIAVNLALSFTRLGHHAAILDADLFGPSIPTLLNLSGHQPRLSSDDLLLPLTNYGLKSMSMGYLLPPSTSPSSQNSESESSSEQAVIWRGPMIIKALTQLLHSVAWGPTDILILDFPPGTGDTQLTITQTIPLDGAVLVSTPQDIALKDTLKGLDMFRKVNVPVLGMVQNMGLFVCPHCGGRTRIFSHEHEHEGHDEDIMGVQKACQAHGIDFLGDIPLHPRICADADRGVPTVVAEPESERAGEFLRIAEKVAGKIGL